jgi:hypothetical protein
VVAGLHPGRAPRIDGNRVTVGQEQYRLGRDRRWYRLVKRSSTWVLTAGPADDPDELAAVTDIGAATDIGTSTDGGAGSFFDPAQ